MHEIDIAGDDISALDRQLAQQQRPFGDRLKRFQGLAQPRFADIDLVDEDDMRDVALIRN